MEYLSIIYKPPGFNPQTQPQKFHEQTLDENNYIENPTPIHLSSEHSLGQWRWAPPPPQPSHSSLKLKKQNVWLNILADLSNPGPPVSPKKQNKAASCSLCINPAGLALWVESQNT